jgi:predicted dienelactone hydrolase
VVSELFSGSLGAVTADVNADGRATAADVTGAALELRNPTWRGPYRVGIVVTSFTKMSVTTGQPRTLDTAIWYPTDADGLPNQYGGIPDAPLLQRVTPFPVLLFSHGSCGYPTQSLFLTPHLASYGIVVVAPSHPGNQLSDFPACFAPANTADSARNRLPDMTFILDVLEEENSNPESMFSQALDLARVGMSGHSFGGQTTLRMAANDDRVVAGLALASASRGIADEVAQIQIPMMIQGGEDDTVLSFEMDMQAAFDLLPPPRYLVAIENTGHYAFSDQCFPSPDCGPDKLTQFEAHQYVLRYAVPFVLSRVVGDDRFAKFLNVAADPPGVKLTADLD